MDITVRPYGQPGDYDSVSRFLIANHLPGNRDGNWLEPRWAYMHAHPNLDRPSLQNIGLWEDGTRLAGVVHHEDRLGTAYLELDPEYPQLKPAMVDYAEQHLRGIAADDSEHLRVYAYEHDHELAEVLAERGFSLDGKWETESTFAITGPVEVPALPPGFRLTSFAEDNDLRKIHRVIWRGFNHPGEPPEEGLIWRVQMQSAAGFRHDLNLVVVAPDGQFVSYAGLWYEPYNRFAMVEPVATDPDFRRMGLARVAVLEGIKRCAAEGAEIAFVGSEQPFYMAIGFRKAHRHLRWAKNYV